MKYALRNAFASVAVMMMATGATAQENDRKLADIRAELGFLSSQLQGLRSELVETGAAQSATASGPALLRVDAIEAELRTLTGQIEQLQFRINQITKDATNRIGDLEFRLTELEGGDLSAVGKPRPIGGTPESSQSDLPEGVELTVAEKADYEAGLASLADGDFDRAISQFDTFIQTYPGGPLTAGAQFHKGEAYVGLGDWKSGGRSFLDSFSSAPSAPTAPKALHQLGVSLGKLGKTQEACQTLGEVETRFPSDPIVVQSTTEMQTLGCS